MNNASVTIVGAGIGGLALAVALRHFGVTNVRVLEREERLAPVGAGIWVPPNAMQVMARLGLAESLEQRGLPLEAIELQRTGGKTIMRVPMEPVRERLGQTTVSIRRAALHDVLIEALPADTVELARRCVEVTSQQSQATVRLADGTEIAAPVVVGADGLHSVVRNAVAPSARIRSHRQVCFRGIARYTLPRQRVCVEVWGGTHRFGYSAIAEDEVYWFATVLESKRPAADIQGEALRDELVRRFAKFPTEVRESLANSDPASIIETPLGDLAPLRRWHTGRIALLGDAAHATTPNLGQGGAQAIEDAWVLGRELADHPNEPATALQRYEAARKSKARFVVRQSRRIGQLAHLKARPLQAALDQALRLTKRQGDRILRRLYAAPE